MFCSFKISLWRSHKSKKKKKKIKYPFVKSIVTSLRIVFNHFYIFAVYSALFFFFPKFSSNDVSFVRHLRLYLIEFLTDFINYSFLFIFILRIKPYDVLTNQILFNIMSGLFVTGIFLLIAYEQSWDWFWLFIYFFFIFLI